MDREISFGGISKFRHDITRRHLGNLFISVELSRYSVVKYEAKSPRLYGKDATSENFVSSIINDEIYWILDFYKCKQNSDANTYEKI